MKITTEIVSKLNPCKDRFENFTDKYPDYNGDLQDFIVLENITYNDKVWVVTRLFTKEQNVKWSILCTSKVLSIFENEYPNDKRPRLALEAAEMYLNEPNEENRVAVYATAYAAVYATAYAYAYAAAYAADAADAAYAAAYAAKSRDTEKMVNLILMLECI